jgi:hypothetical protein
VDEHPRQQRFVPQLLAAFARDADDADQALAIEGTQSPAVVGVGGRDAGRSIVER